MYKYLNWENEEVHYFKKNQHILIHHVYGNPIFSQNFLHGL